MIQKLKNLFKKKENKNVNVVYTDTSNSSIEEWKFINHPFQKPEVTEIKELEVSKITYNEELHKQAEETLFQMKKVKRASEKVLEKMIHTEKQLEDSIRYYEHKHEHSKSHR
jgi:hypothetical protein